MRKTIIYILILISSYHLFNHDIFAQSDKNYYQIEEDGYFINPQYSSYGVICTDNYSSRIYLISDNELNVLVERPGCGRYFSMSPDGNKIGYKFITDDKNQIPSIYDLSLKKSVNLFQPSVLCGQPSFDDTGNIFFTVGDSLYISNNNMSESISLNQYSNIIAPSKDGLFIAFTNRNGSLSVLDVRRRRIKELKDTNNAVYPQWSPDGEKLSFSSITGQLFYWDRLDNRVREVGNGGSVAWLENSKGFIYQQNKVEIGHSFSSDLFYFDINTEEQFNITNTPLLSECNPSIIDNKLLFHTFDKGEICEAIFDAELYEISETNKLVSWPDTLSIRYYTYEKPQLRNYVFLGESPYVNQVYDTPGFHDGAGGCGPTTAVMTLAYYNRLPEWPTEIDKLFLHVNNYGSYIADKYHYNEYFYDTYTSPYGSDSWGAHSYMWSGSGSPNSTMAGYYENHLLEITQQWTTQCSFQKTVDEIDNGFPHTICAFMTASGHILMAKGYDDIAHSLIFHDPFGDRNTPGYPSYDGNDVIYDWPGFNNGNQNLDPDGSHGGVAWTITTQTNESVYNDTIIDDMDFGHGFYMFNEPPSHMKYFRDQLLGFNNHSWWTVTIESDDVCFVTWEPTISQVGYYEVSTFVPSDFADAEQSTYQLNLSGLDTTIIINQSEYNDEWALLGWFELNPDSINQIYLGDSTGVSGQSMVFDAMKFSRVLTVGAEDISDTHNFGLSVFPNPVIDLLNIKIEGLAKDNFTLLEIFNLNMQLVDSYQFIPGDLFTIPISNYTNGTYLIRFSSENEVLHSKFVVLH